MTANLLSTFLIDAAFVALFVVIAVEIGVKIAAAIKRSNGERISEAWERSARVAAHASWALLSATFASVVIQFVDQLYLKVVIVLLGAALVGWQVHAAVTSGRATDWGV